MRTAWAWAILCGAAWAQDPPQPTPPQERKPDEPPTFTVYGHSPTRGERLFDAPQSIDVVTSRELQERGIRTMPEMLQGVTGVSVQKTGYGQGSPFIRGFTGFRNVIVIDGIRLNNSIFREGPNQYWNTVDAFLIDRLELVRGPSSVLYGSDSMGGTVVAFTKEPGSFDAGLHVHGRAYGRYASAERSYTARAETWGNSDDVGWFAGGTYRDYNDLDGGRHIGEMPETGYDEYDADAKLVFRLSKGEKIVLAYQHTRQDDAPRTHRTVLSQPWHGTVRGTDLRHDFDQERDLAYAQYHGAFQGGVVDALKASVSWQRMGETLHRVTGGGTREYRDLEVQTPAVWVQAGKLTGLGYFTAGAEYYRDFVESSGHNGLSSGQEIQFERGTVADDATYDLWGIYLQDEFSIGSLDVTPGIRFSRAEVEAEEVDPNSLDAFPLSPVEEEYQAVTGSLRLLYHMTENWNVIGGWGMGFRAPSLDDLTAISLVLSGTLDLPSGDLDPEKIHTFDLGVRARYPRWEASAFVFYSVLDDFLVRVPGSVAGLNGFVKENGGDGYVYGYEVGALVRATDEITFFFDWGYAKGEVEQLVNGVEDEQPLSKVGPSLAHLGARYVPAGSKVWVEGLVTSARHQHHLSVSDTTDTQRIPPGGTPGYTIYTLRGGYEINAHAAVTAAVENIGNKDYRIHGSGQNEPGTNFILGLDLRF